ncbi:hypothetical protein [Levilactobacillus suantsaiihabitans]|uniref:hypothetical protein n=1 Tax=Levilactobacillus suantsaiihabitans TaxID=2487722 RepID=UPI00107F3B0E|nr:hypothetical protein [Levilactobacillus suantsaiihabitans]
MLRKKFVVALCIFLGTVEVGCTAQPSKKTEASSTSKARTSSVKSSSSSKASPVGKVISTEKMDPDIGYKVANKKTVFYRSLKEYGTKDGIISDNITARGSIFGAIKKYETTTGVYYRVVMFYPNGFENKNSPENSGDTTEITNYGFVKADGLKPFSTVKSEWRYSQKQPYYVGNPYEHRIWSAPANTKHYTYVTHVFDRLARTQLYATKELVKYNGSHYVYLSTAKRPLGWVYKSPKTLIAGYYRDPGQQLLKPKAHEKMVVKKQSRKSAGTRVDVSDSTALPQRVYQIRNKRKHTLRVLTMGMDNRPIRIDFKRGKAVKVRTFEYWRKPWKTITNKKKLRTHFTVSHDFVEASWSTVHFYKHQSKKLVRVRTYGTDSYATIWIYRNGKVGFKTVMPKDIMSYPLADFK